MLAFVLPLPVEHNHVHVLRWLGAKLAEHGCDLSAMIAAVIHNVLQHFPERDSGGEIRPTGKKPR